MSDHNPAHFTSGPGATERAQRGQARMRQITAETQATVKSNVAAMLAGLRQLGHEPTMIDEMDATALCALGLQASRLRAKGQPEHEVWREYAAVRAQSAWAHPLPLYVKRD
jgi:hypothetical protein